MAEPGKHPQGQDVGGISQNIDAGLSDMAERSSERRDDDPTGRASIGDAFGTAADPRPDLGGTPEPGASSSASSAGQRPAAGQAAPTRGTSKRGGFDDEDEDASHPPIAPKDKRVVDSLGASIGEVITGGMEDASGKPKI